MTRVVASGLALFVFMLLVGGATEAVAQTAPGASAASMRHFWHVFAAYAVAWLLILGWLFSVARRIGRLERRLDR